jgi:antitoxin FitA
MASFAQVELKVLYSAKLTNYLTFAGTWPARISLQRSTVFSGAIIDSMKGGAMNQLIVRNLEEEVVQALKIRAARHGRSAEAEHREILREALLPSRPKKTLKELLLAMPAAGEDADFERSPDLGRDVEL